MDSLSGGPISDLSPTEARFMPEIDEEPADDLEDLETTGKVNFRDYPSSGLVVIAALSSGLGFMLYKWLGRKRRAGQAGPADGETNAPTVTEEPGSKSS
jgi:hypothetical protein